MNLEYKTLAVETLCSTTLGYQQIDTPDECEFAARTLKKSEIAPKLIYAEEYPSGCYFDLDEQIVFFNQMQKGRYDYQCAPICGRQGNLKLLQSINHIYEILMK